jgi:hypothetical protein
MAATLFYGWTEADLLKALRKAQEDFQRGSALVGSGAGDVSSTLIMQKNARERIEELQMALYQLNSTTYAAFALVGQNQTIGNFSA